MPKLTLVSQKYVFMRFMQHNNPFCHRYRYMMKYVITAFDTCFFIQQLPHKAINMKNIIKVMKFILLSLSVE